MNLISEQAIQTNRYPAYKDSGIDWLGEIPAHWEVMRVKNIFRLVIEPAPVNNDYELLSVYSDIGVKPRKELEERGNRASTTDGYWLVKKGDIIVNKLLAWMGAIGLSEYDGVTSPAYDILRAKRPISGWYYHALLRSPLCSSELKRHSRGIMDMRLRLYFDKFGDVMVPYPSHEEQTQITEFLSRKTAQIDQAIAQKERLIDLLNERRQVLIHRAVTRGLDPNVPMKDSGIEWIGEIPAHWEVKKLKHLTTKIGSGVTPAGGATGYLDSGIPLLRSQNILWGKIDFGEVAYISEATHRTMNNSHVYKGDVLLNITGGSIGRCHYVEIDMPINVNQHVCIIRPVKEIDTVFLNGLLASKVGQGQIWFYQQGGGREGLNFQAIKNFNIPLPPKDEQQNITIHLKAIAKQFDVVIQREEYQIQKLQELKATLINSAVTGKIKV